MLLMSVGFELISEKETRNNSFLQITSEMNSILSQLEARTTITYEQLAKMTDDEKYLLALYDNGRPLSHTANILTKEQQELAMEILTENQDLVSSLDTLPQHGYYGTVHQEFQYHSRLKQAPAYYVSYANIKRSAGILNVLILYSTAPLEHLLFRQRILLFGANLIGILLLAVFTWFYTGRLLPILEAQKQQSAFIAAASHELRTPLSVILSCASAVRYAEHTERTSFLDIIHTEGARMSHLIDDLLTLAHSDSRRLSFHMQEIELDTLLLNIYEAYKPIASRQGIVLSLLLPEETFPTCRCDRERIIQVVEILLSNALSYSRENGHIAMRLTYSRRGFQLEVKDDGVGISNLAKKHIFERFYREDPARSKKEHFGLGLSIAQEIVHAHRGKISVSDTPGGGATFTVLLP